MALQVDVATYISAKHGLTIPPFTTAPRLPLGCTDVLGTVTPKEEAGFNPHHSQRRRYRNI